MPKWDMPIMTFLMSKAMPNAAGTRTWVTETPLSEIVGPTIIHPDDRSIMFDFLQNVKRGLAHKLSQEVRS